MVDKNTVGIIGAGAWGTAVGKAIAQKGISVQLWSFEQDVADSINNEHENKRYLPGTKLPDTLTATSDLIEAASRKDYIILATPSLFLLGIAKQIITVPNIMEGKSTIGIITKGFLPGEDKPKPIVEVLENYLPGFYKGNLVYISGPSHAEEVAQGMLTGLISASINPKNSIRFRELLNSDSLKVYSSLDVVGVQTSAALKNVIAIAFGAIDALKEDSKIFGDNAESLVLAAGLNELMLLGKAMGATHPETFTSIAGVGDLDVTCRSVHGRNRRFGRDIVLKGIIDPYDNIDEILDNITKLPYLPEGVAACKMAYQLMLAFNLKLNIINFVYKVLNKEYTPKDALESILFK
ncbi:NAD(P)H-dependent glycerol-3-phosphate dehydrogenase [Spirochaeta cellobiosiphila]|uniref:NAD(P)H-dependent glycerol-3-phosphate dehydrogenase n=1 Tax=Spirochaeta cellobiosiphila TaxID=504483 RepID=UPI000427B24E|nr:NAD(P)H-dependent glycerol-3-phosphate dehydrogenase [Spirochaeta cellobiosiphila]